MNTIEKIEDYIDSVQERFASAWTGAELPNVREAVNSLWLDITRYGPDIPAFPQVRIPGLGDFEVPPPPLPPPPPPTLYDNAVDWVEHHPILTGSIAVGAVGSALLVGYGSVYLRAARIKRLKEGASAPREVVVVLGGDTSFALPLIHDLENKGYIVIASVATPSAANDLERKCRGYVRALVLDPSAPDTIPVFLRSLASTVNRKFPITSAGDPFLAVSTHPYIRSIISLLTIPNHPIHAPLEHLSLTDTYLPRLIETQITPLSVIQALLPMLRGSQAKKSIIVCLPSIPTRIGLPFDSAQAMSAASTLRAVEILRREVKAAALSGKSEFMKHIKVVIVDIGSFNVPSNLLPEDVYKAMEKWTSSEKLTYGPAFAAATQQTPGVVGRKATDIRVFVDSVVDIVSNGKFGPTLFGINLGIGKLRNWLRGDRFNVGAGASTYKLASLLPTSILNHLLSMPHFLVGIRNSLLSSPGFQVLPALPPAVTTSRRPLPQDISDHDESSNNELSEAGSEADVESNEGDGTNSGVENSWISLKNGE